jgi:transposase
MKAIPVPVRERILHLYDQGKSTGEIAASLGYCVAAVRRVRQHFKARGTVEPQTHRCGRKTLLTARRRAVAARRGGAKKAVAPAAGGRAGGATGVLG